MVLTRATVVGLAIAMAAVAGGLGGCKKAEHARIGTGSQTGVYYPAGGAIAKRVHATNGDHGIKVSVLVTGGSVYNINAVLSGDLEFGICQPDRQFQACNGLAEWSERGPQDDLRAVCSLHREIVTLVCADDTGAKTLDDLKGLKVNIGNPGSGQRGNALAIFQAVGIDPEKDIQAESLKPAESAQMLQDGKIDAFFYTVGHPNGAIKEATAGQRRTVRFIPITGMDKLLADAPYYTPAAIRVGELYPKAVHDANEVMSIGMPATLVTSARVPEEMVYVVTKALFEGLEEFRQAHPAFADLTPEGMLQGHTAPFHDGAKKYFQEAGLMGEGQ
jgi:hypothetical protein